MYASVSSGQVQPGKLDKYLSIYRESVKPVIEGFPGIKNLYVLTDAEKGKGMVIVIYETVADAERTQASGDYQKVIGMLSSTLVLESVVREGYEVSIQI
jgi:heme-degrading monooxygenase HmoA